MARTKYSLEQRIAQFRLRAWCRTLPRIKGCCICGRCRACAVRWLRRQQAEQWARQAAQFPFPPPTMYGLIRAADMGAIRRTPAHNGAA